MDYKKKIQARAARQVTLNGKPILFHSIQVEGVDSADYPKFSDAFISEAKFADGTLLSDPELRQLEAENYDAINEIANASFQ